MNPHNIRPVTGKQIRIFLRYIDVDDYTTALIISACNITWPASTIPASKLRRERESNGTRDRSAPFARSNRVWGTSAV